MPTREWTAIDPAVAFFPVALRPVFIEAVSKPQGTSDLFQEQYQQLPRHQAVVDLETGHTFAVVTDDYQLISNKKAYDFASSVMQEVFKLVTLDDMLCLNVTMPKMRSFCHIDLIHKNSTFEPWKDDRWTAFVRITNSYNRTRRLRYELGFCRWICLNGMIFGSKSVEISFAHTKGYDSELRRWQENLQSIKALEAQLTAQLQNLKRYHVPAKVMLPLACKTFDIQLNPKEQVKPKRAEELIAFRNQIIALSTEYFAEMGEHGYAALNVLTDYATRPVGVMAPESSMDSLQHKAGDWMNDFVEQIQHREFTFEHYLAEYRATAEVIAGL